MARKKNIQRRREILDNTFRLVRVYGFEHVSLQEIAEDSGISKSLLQSYYPHKSTLMTDIVRNLFNTMWDQINANYHEPKKNPFVRTKAMICIAIRLGMKDTGLGQVITEAFTNQRSLDNWSKMIDEWMKSQDAFAQYKNYSEIRTGMAFILTGTGRLYRDRAKHKLTAEEMADYATSSLMFSFYHAQPAKIRAALAEGHQVIENCSIDEIHHAIDTMFEKDRAIL